MSAAAVAAPTPSLSKEPIGFLERLHFIVILSISVDRFAPCVCTQTQFAKAVTCDLDNLYFFAKR